MSVRPEADRAALPRTDHTHTPVRFFLRTNRWWARWLLRRRYDVRLHGTDLVPDTGPVIYAANHIGVLDGPLVAIFAPRPAHALTKREMFGGLLGRFLLLAGQIPLDRFHPDPRAVKRCLHVLRTGGAVAIFPEGARGSGDLARFHRGAGYLALVSGAPVVPVIVFGSRDPGGTSGSLPHRGARIDLVFGAPHTLPATPWPRTKEQVERASMLLREHLRVHLEHAQALTGRDLPGPLPSGDRDPDPATGVTDEGAP